MKTLMTEIEMFTTLSSLSIKYNYLIGTLLFPQMNQKTSMGTPANKITNYSKLLPKRQYMYVK